MQSNYQARWISRRRVNELIKTKKLGKTMHLDHLNGILVIEPVGSDWGDGRVLPPQEADYELQPAWILEPQTRLRQARELLGLETEQLAAAGANVTR
jgi:hypothetical protein